MKSEMVVVESLEISNLYIKNKEIRRKLLWNVYANAKIQITNFRNGRLYCDRYRPNIPSVLLTIMMLT